MSSNIRVLTNGTNTIHTQASNSKAMKMVSKNYLPRTGLTVEHAKKLIQDPFDEAAVQGQLHQMVKDKKDLNSVSKFALRKRMCKAAQEEKIKVHNIPVGGWKDLQNAWMEDHTAEMAPKMWQALFGTFDEPGAWDKLEIDIMHELGWYYDASDKTKKTFINKTLKHQKGEQTRQVLDPVI